MVDNQRVRVRYIQPGLDDCRAYEHVDIAMPEIADDDAFICSLQMDNAVFTSFVHQMTIRMEDTTVMDYLGYATRHFVTSQKYYEWR